MLSVRIDGVSAAADRVVSFKSNCSFSGIPLGAAVSRAFTLTLAGDDIEASPGARVETFYGNEPCGVWYVTEAAKPAGGGCTVLRGQDALGTYLNEGFKDSKSAYPRTVKALLLAVIAACPGLTLKSGGFPRAETRISRMPEWALGVTLRQIAGFIAFLAGGAARIDDAGRLEIVPLSCGAVHEPSVCDLSLSGGTPFSLNCVRYRFDGDAEYTRFARENTGDTASDTLTAMGNPLINRARMNEIASELYGFYGEGGSAKVYGFLPALIGDTLACEGHVLPVTGTKTQIDSSGAFTYISASLPAAHKSGPLTGAKAFNPDGSINSDAVGGLDDRIIGMEKAYIQNLTADEISAAELHSKLVTALTVKAQAINAQEASTDSLTALAAEIGRASLRKIEAGTVVSDELTAAAADIIAARIESVSAGGISADRLLAALAAFNVITAGSAEFDRETVRHLIANLLNVEDAVGGRVMIKNLSADYASMVTAYVGSLCVKGKDGSFYRLNVDSDGNVHPELAAVTEDEAAAGKTDSGLPIIESQMTVSDLTATSFRAVSALVTKLNAVTVDADALIARQAFIDRLKTVNITSDGPLLTQLTTADEVRRYMTFDAVNGLTQRMPESVYFTRVDNSGFYVMCDRSALPLASMNAAGGLTASRMTVGRIRMNKTSRGGWVWQAEED